MSRTSYLSTLIFLAAMRLPQLLAALCCLLVAVLPQAHCVDPHYAADAALFASFMEQYNIAYTSDAEHAKRFGIFRVRILLGIRTVLGNLLRVACARASIECILPFLGSLPCYCLFISGSRYLCLISLVLARPFISLSISTAHQLV